MIRSYILILAIGILAIGCAESSSVEDGFAKISGKLSNAANEELYFNPYLSTIPSDTVVIDAEGNFEITVPTGPVDFYKLYLDQRNMIILVIDEETKHIKVKGDAKNFTNDYDIEGSKATSEMRQYFVWNRDYIAGEKELIGKINSTTGSDRKLLQEEKRAKKKVYTDKLREFALTNPSSPAALTMVSNINPRDNMDAFDLVIEKLAPVMPHCQIYNDLVKDITDYKGKLAAKEKAKQQQKISDTKSGIPQVGDMAPDIVLNNPEGKTLKLSSLKGKYVLIDFWASWCGPCRRENPNVVKVYDEYKNKGFEILGVSLDKTKAPWIAAIEKDQLEWPQVSDLAGWSSSAAAKYGVRSIPHTVLIDRDGKIIATKLRGSSLERKLEELLGGPA